MNRKLRSAKLALLIASHAVLFGVLVIAGALLGLLGDKALGWQGFEAGPLPLLGMATGAVLTLVAVCWTINRSRRSAA